MPINRLDAYSKLMEEATTEVKPSPDIANIKTAQELLEIKKKLEELEKRNERVELNKAWETSTFRKVAVTIVTYFVVALFFVAAELPNPFVSAIVPTLGFVLSTMSFPFFKNYWINHKFDRKYKRKNK